MHIILSRTQRISGPPRQHYAFTILISRANNTIRSPLISQRMLSPRHSHNAKPSNRPIALDRRMTLPIQFHFPWPTTPQTLLAIGKSAEYFVKITTINFHPFLKQRPPTTRTLPTFLILQPRMLIKIIRNSPIDSRQVIILCFRVRRFNCAQQNSEASKVPIHPIDNIYQPMDRPYQNRTVKI